MGEMADYYADLAIEAEYHWEYKDTHYGDIHYKNLLREYLKGMLYWRKKDGNHILIQDMEDSHLLNSISWIEKNNLDHTCMVEMREILLIEKQKRYEKRK
jgi:hypothetical protein